MDKEKSLGEIIAEVDAQLKAGEDAVAEARLREAIAAYTEAAPGNVVGRSVLLNEDFLASDKSHLHHTLAKRSVTQNFDNHATFASLYV